MKHIFIRYAFSALCLLLCACSSGKNENNNKEVVEGGTVPTKYNNPVIPISVPDPTVLRAPDGYFYLYGTEDIHNLPIYRSKDLVKWEQRGTVFTDETRPKDVEGASLWAPEIRYINGKYLLLYSLAKWGKHWVSTVGYATADSPEGPFTAKGVVFSSKDVDVENSIDQFMYEEDGKYYMLWGSFFGLYLMELNVTDDLTITPQLETKQRVAGNAFEAVNLWKRNGYYYLFASVGSCCEGANSTYTMVVGRSKNLEGPYLAKDGGAMMDNAYTTVISKSTAFIGTGHNSILLEDDGGNTWTLYHAFRADRPEDGRIVLLDRVLWDEDGWPYVENGQASTKAACPVINK